MCGRILFSEVKKTSVVGKKLKKLDLLRKDCEGRLPLCDVNLSFQCSLTKAYFSC